jgi:hypothetical protein
VAGSISFIASSREPQPGTGDAFRADFRLRTQFPEEGLDLISGKIPEDILHVFQAGSLRCGVLDVL